MICNHQGRIYTYHTQVIWISNQNREYIIRTINKQNDYMITLLNDYFIKKLYDYVII